MKISQFIFVGVIALALSSCDTLSRRQFVIRGGANPEDEKTVISLMASAASAVGFIDTDSPEYQKEFAGMAQMVANEFGTENVIAQPITSASRGFLACYGQLGKNTNLDSFVSDGDIIVLLHSIHGGLSSRAAPREYKKINSILSKELPKVFGDRLVIDPKLPSAPYREVKAASQ